MSYDADADADCPSSSFLISGAVIGVDPLSIMSIVVVGAG